MKVLPNLYFYPWESMTENNCNTFVIKGKTNILIDPGHYHLLHELQRKMTGDGLSFDDIDLVLVTHPHPDHIEGIAYWNSMDTVVAIHKEAHEFIEKYRSFWEEATGKTMPHFNVDIFLKEGTLRAGGNTIQVIYTPGHAPGSVCFFWEESKVLFSGDVVFAQSFGRFDLPGADPVLLLQSLEKLVSLDVDVLAPGHGPIIQGKGAVKENFYIVLGLFQQTVMKSMQNNETTL